MLKTTKQERDALFAARRKLADALSFLRSKGFKEEQIFEAQQKDGFGPKPLIRDEYGLPVRNDVAGMKSPNPYVDKLKNKLEIDSNGAESDVGHDAHQVVGGKPQPKIANTQSVFGKLPKTDSHPAVDVKDGSVEGKIMGNGTSQSWAHVLKKDAAAIINFKYHPLGTEKIVEPPLEVAVSYPFRPLFCTGCKSLGHTVGACPSVSRIWVPKTTKVSDVTNAKADAKTDVKEAVKGMQDEPVIERVPVHVDKPIAETKDSPSTEDWTEVKRKKAAKASSESEASPTPPRTFVNLRNVDEIDQQARLTRSQRKRLRRLKGSSPPQPSV
ncbi:hypothetical protein ACET3Z_010405 [Daucus carota]